MKRVLLDVSRGAARLSCSRDLGALPNRRLEGKPKNLVTTLTKTQVRKLANEQAKPAFGRTPAQVVRGVRDGSIPKSAVATNIAMLFSLID